MGWSGYWAYGSVEVINASRVEAYAEFANLGWFKPVYSNDALGAVLGEHYDSPLQDLPSWVDEDEPESLDFYGVYPLEITGVEDSTGAAEVVESVHDGGLVGNRRYATKAVVFSVVLIGESDCAVEYGFRWLRDLLDDRDCYGQSQCRGHDLTYLSCAPSVDWAGGGSFDLTLCLPPYLRYLRAVTTTVGPSITAKMDMPSGGCAWTVTWTMTAGDPAEYGALQPVVTGFLDPTVEVPYPGGIVPPGAMFDPDGAVEVETECPVAVYEPIFDPLCPLIVNPPSIPSLDLQCFNFPSSFMRRQFVVPDHQVPTWGSVVPVLTITASTEVRNLRVRIYPNPGGDNEIADEDLCTFVSDVIFTYIPAGFTLVFDAISKEVYVEDPEHGKRRADSLLAATDGSPFQWPSLSCGESFIVTVDTEQTQVPPVIDFGLASKVA